jgi:hypothetical protein
MLYGLATVGSLLSRSEFGTGCRDDMGEQHMVRRLAYQYKAETSPGQALGMTALVWVQ